MGGTTHMRRSETSKIDFSRYKGTDEDSLLRWFVELDDAIRARHIEGDEMQVTFALSNVTGRAKTWALGLKLHDPNVFESLEILKSRLKETFEPPRAESRARSALSRLKQGKRDVHAYAQHLRYLAISVTESHVDEHTLINVFIYGTVGWASEDLHFPRGLPYAGKGDSVCGTRRLQPETVSGKLIELSIDEKTGNRRSRNNGPLLHQERELLLCESQANGKMPSLSKHWALSS
uniref:Retrotransposon gag domain-containing protein n=1 Tax=Peronospora matthiolae TaxID=2874970 RepID=A0AAV1TPY7_9STRA